MSVRQSLLAILDQGPCYGYQLRAEFDRRTGSTWPLNVGQIYNTLERLERDGLVERGHVDEHGHAYWQITPAGSAEVAIWLSGAVPHAQGTRDEFTIKVALAATLPGVGVSEILAVQRAAAQERLDALQEVGPEATTAPEDLAASVVRDAMRFSVEAELRFIAHLEQRLPSQAATQGIPLTTTRPKRGRPPHPPHPPHAHPPS